ncbi:Putative tyrosine-protein kinase Wsck [Frankliniella fusca]|uniref:Tyrosine-protein kinase Wsck n=1 Tax=Frankliniella fusca TaxID=407009 RepID=A0AAE1H4V8_9NEOP|nr:Putative tyrosine-protein kinase Wsck [Frankliniella fusca]
MTQEAVRLLSFVIISVFAQIANTLQPTTDNLVGCFKSGAIDQNANTTFLPMKSNAGETVDNCVFECSTNFFRYAVLQNGQNCSCSSKYEALGTAEESQCDKPCKGNISQICGGQYASSVYDTGQKVPGPPSSLEVYNISQHGFRVSWLPPAASNGVIHSYTVSAELLKTYSHLQLSPVMSWTYSATVNSADVLDLHPGSEYRVKVLAESDNGVGVPAQIFVGTHVGDPDIPNEPEIVQKYLSDGQIVIRFNEGVSENGPITGYRIVVICGIAEFDQELLDSYYNAEKKGLPYYIAASLGPKAWTQNFTVGDGRRYGDYDNVRLHFDDTKCNENDIQIALGVVSADENHTCVSYSSLHSEKSVKIVMPESKGEGLESGLIAAIVVCSVLLILVVIAYFAARHFAPQRQGASRMEDPQEMCLQGPMIEVENYGYLPEEEEENRTDHYDRLKKILWDIPRNFLDIQSNNTIGRGEFGSFMKGTVLQNGYPTPSAIQCIEDGMLSAATKRSMLQELALLINCGTGNHSNVIRLVGTCESPEMLYVVLEYHPATLKDILLESRTLERPGYDRDLSSVCSLPQQAFLQIAIGIAQGMAHLASNKVIHKQLAACSILMADGMVPKITNFGIAKCNKSQVVPDFTRWTAREIFRSQHFTVKSDVWAMGCLLWEMAALGGTLYNNVPTAEVAARVMRGLRPQHLSYVSHDLYQLMLQCWQLDLDERPDFAEISTSLCELINNNETHLDWNVVPGFQYEQYLSELETIKQR